MRKRNVFLFSLISLCAFTLISHEAAGQNNNGIRKGKLARARQQQKVFRLAVNIEVRATGPSGAFVSLEDSKVIQAGDVSNSGEKVRNVDLYFEDDPEIMGLNTWNFRGKYRFPIETFVAPMATKTFEEIESVPSNVEWQGRLRGTEEIKPSSIFLVQSRSGKFFKVRVDSYDKRKREFRLSFLEIKATAP